MDWMNDSDWNTQARFATPEGEVLIAAHARGYADGVSIESVPSADGYNLLVLFRAEAGHTGAALRLKDLLQATKEHHPELWAEVASMGQEMTATQKVPNENTSGYAYHGTYNYG